MDTVATKEVTNEEVIVRGRQAAGVVDFIGHVGDAVNASGTAGSRGREIRAGTAWNLSGVYGFASRRKIRGGWFKVGKCDSHGAPYAGTESQDNP